VFKLLCGKKSCSAKSIQAALSFVTIGNIYCSQVTKFRVCIRRLLMSFSYSSQFLLKEKKRVWSQIVKLTV